MILCKSTYFSQIIKTSNVQQCSAKQNDTSRHSYNNSDAHSISLHDQCLHLLEPFFNLIKLVHRYGVDHCHFFVVVFKYKHHVEVLQMKLHSFKVYNFDLFKRDNKWRLQKTVLFQCKKIISSNGTCVTQVLTNQHSINMHLK